MGGMPIRHFRRFRQNGPFLAGDKSTVYQKHGFWEPVDPVVTDPVPQDNDKRNTIQIYTENPY